MQSKSVKPPGRWTRIVTKPLWEVGHNLLSLLGRRSSLTSVQSKSVKRLRAEGANLQTEFRRREELRNDVDAAREKVLDPRINAGYG